MKNRWLGMILGGALTLGANSARAQGPGDDAMMPSPGAAVELMGFEDIHGGKLVKGAPFSAVSSSETTQTLSDGTVIRRTSQGVVYRDSEGRSRRETTISGFGAMAATGGSHKMVMIADPVAGVHYMLDAQNKVAHKMTPPAAGQSPAGTDQMQQFHEKMQAHKLQAEASGALKTESLGNQTINGVNAAGTRMTHTIAVGEIGNDKAIQVVSERWLSADLQTVVKSTRTDPRFGTTVYTLTNIQRTEPAANLFTVPADYTVKEGPGPHGMHMHMPGAGAPPPSN